MRHRTSNREFSEDKIKVVEKKIKTFNIFSLQLIIIETALRFYIIPFMSKIENKK